MTKVTTVILFDAIGRIVYDFYYIILGESDLLPTSNVKKPWRWRNLKKLILDYDIDITSLTEVNKDWRKVEYDNTIWGSTAGWRENRRVQVSHNKSVALGDSEFQVGGTVMLMLGDVSFRISDQGEDSRNLGQWSYITLTGKNNATTTIFTCYWPCHSPCTGSAFVQQMLYMAIHKET
jgi:hypothetical protein